ncbi:MULTISPECIES: peptidase inhibitor family I36 protein [unclassified Streptomyces]|uniref:peptidase inhibitor family I36 protein n=1 Tax=unclassified Streptomyces TaxID=2593676 RepID=UPI0038090350
MLPSSAIVAAPAATPQSTAKDKSVVASTCPQGYVCGWPQPNRQGKRLAFKVTSGCGCFPNSRSVSNQSGYLIRFHHDTIGNLAGPSPRSCGKSAHRPQERDITITKRSESHG